MRRLCAGLLALAVAASTMASGAEIRDESLVGLWEAKRFFGPEVRGELVLVPRHGAVVAEIAGFSAPVEVARGGEYSFELPDGRGSFRGKVAASGGEIAGFWIQPASPLSGLPYSSPVKLRKVGDTWRGEVIPLDHVYHVYLPVTRAADGSLATYLRNPERNDGIFWQVTALQRSDDRILLVGNRRGRTERTTLLEGRGGATGFTIPFPERGGTYAFSKVDGESANAFYPRGRNPARYRYAKPLQRDDGWPTGTLEEVGLSRAAIEAFVQYLVDMPMTSVNSSQIHSLLIARHGKLVLEEYFHGHHRDQPHDTRSAAKSMFSVLVGAAMQAGIPIRESTPVYETMLGTLPADIDPRKRAMKLVDLLTMTGGHFCDDGNPDAPGNEDAMQEQEKERDWYRYILAVPMDRNPGEKLVYCSIDPHLAGGVLAKVAGEPLPELFDRLVARPMRFGPYYMMLSPTGAGYMGGGSQFLPRDFMKIAQLMVDGGKWEGRAIVSPEWVRRSGAALRAIGTSGQRYGYLWNSYEYPYRDRKVRAIFAGGNGGQVSIAIPDLDLAIVFTGGNYADASLFIPQRAMVPERILTAVDPR
jgi:CubicO group peptidase (beta-lactamase class C family)